METCPYSICPFCG